MDALQTDLERLKRELAAAWASKESAARVPVIEHRIRKVWEQMDGLACMLSEPIKPRSHETRTDALAAV